jgi:hypothetical protein
MLFCGFIHKPGNSVLLSYVLELCPGNQQLHAAFALDQARCGKEACRGCQMQADQFKQSCHKLQFNRFTCRIAVLLLHGMPTHRNTQMKHGHNLAPEYCH